jgi:hypothetical protein
MKKIIGAIFAMSLILPVYATDKKPETKRVCVDARDKSGNVIKNKDGSVRKDCREIKVHKKFEGTPIPKN